MTTTMNAAHRRLGDQYRALLRDPAWVLAADEEDLRSAVHALAWRNEKGLIAAVCADRRSCEKIRPVARLVKAELTELASRASGAPRTADSRERNRALARRRAAVNTLIEALNAARSDRTAAFHPLVDAVATHRRETSPDEASDADRALWSALASIEHGATRA
ncbi:Uncharacterised protein (plasmid) [Tsukamurella tyrosinosolvens]|uniref:Uncharacterized protein n=1 Tax=Tsukamurella tyrosinosolvens TaxID=57704 RepID=A0A1H4UCD4_TSUTY|nr:hypothetical protein [Tsukamurella tyrosinosolvens]KXO92963.1 hypothetical protein AXK58_13920 [Tsukamurella tyrosinosolvens]SEC66399.1 hypothetical protein SAMN04489793_2853 [Tsukamurella tyrosinosolvens]VEH94129.1 Uncharacterised protein [Tsukamurella tyrosinosolvens]